MWHGKNEVPGEKPVPVPLSPPQTTHGLAQNWNQTSARLETAWAMAWPSLLFYDHQFHAPINAYVTEAVSALEFLTKILHFIFHHNLTFRWLRIMTNSYNNTNKMHQISQIYFWNKTLHVSDRSSIRNMFYSKNKFEKLVHLFGFIIGIFHRKFQAYDSNTYKSFSSGNFPHFSVTFSFLRHCNGSLKIPMNNAAQDPTQC